MRSTIRMIITVADKKFNLSYLASNFIPDFI